MSRLKDLVSYYKTKLHNGPNWVWQERVHIRCLELSNNSGSVIITKEEVKVTQTHVMTSFRDSIAFSSVILSGLSSDVCFFMSANVEEEEKKNAW